MQKIIYRIEEENTAILDALDEECYVLNAALDEDFCLKFIAVASKTDRIVLFYGVNAVDVCKKCGGDGVIVNLGDKDLKNKMAELRKTLGKGKFIGLFTRNRRHESMLVSEVEPDFVIFKVWNDGFGNVKELTDWYQDFFLIQSAAWLMDDDMPDVASLQTDFLIKKIG